MRKYLKGLSNAAVFPITTNTDTAYAVGTKISVPHIQSLSKEVDSSESSIYADDVLYDQETNINGEKFTVVLAELSNELRAKLEGGTYNSTEKEYTFGSNVVAPEFAFVFAAQLADGNYRMWRQYRAKITKIKGDLKTKGDQTGGNPITLEGIFMARTCDKNMFTIKDTETSADLAWLNEIDEYPVV